ncbi:MAG: hypothetical protein U0R68_11405 [Candidatus Nanopelagicales bacterium]
MTRFIGISDQLARTQTQRSDLYEFRTTSGAHVYLHDTDLRRIATDVGSPGRLHLTFEYDPEWVPPELASTPVIQFDCHEATMIAWDIDQDSVSDPDAPQGQVSFFDWDGLDGFSLQTYSRFLTFTTGLVSVSLLPSDRA